MKVGYVYWIHLKDQWDPTEDGYIGVSRDPEQRFKQHRKTTNPLLAEGMKNPDVVMDIMFVGSYECAMMRERCFRPRPNMGWNINIGGKVPPNQKGKPKSEHTKQLMSENNVGMIGKKHSEETKEKMRLSHQKIPGIPHTEETKKKLSEIAKNRKTHPMTGRKHSPETRLLISKSKLKKRDTHIYKGEEDE
jgi:predicted GIY-YIG superfamily endonuclease